MAAHRGAELQPLALRDGREGRRRLAEQFLGIGILDLEGEASLDQRGGVAEIVDQRGHPPRGAVDRLAGYVDGIVGRRAPGQGLGAGVDGGERVAQVVVAISSFLLASASLVCR